MKKGIIYLAVSVSIMIALVLMTGIPILVFPKKVLLRKKVAAWPISTSITRIYESKTLAACNSNMGQSGQSVLLIKER